VFHLAGQPGVRKSWGREFHVYTVNNVDATQTLLEACVGRPIERFAMRPRCRCGKTLISCRSPPTGSRRWPPNSCAISTR
jgi:hypothetical protein